MHSSSAPGCVGSISPQSCTAWSLTLPARHNAGVNVDRAPSGRASLRRSLRRSFERRVAAGRLTRAAMREREEREAEAALAEGELAALDAFSALAGAFDSGPLRV